MKDELEYPDKSCQSGAVRHTPEGLWTMGSVNSNPPVEDLLTSERLLQHYCILCHWHHLGHKAVVYWYSLSAFFPPRLLCWFLTTRRRIQTCAHTISAPTQPKIWSPGWRLWRTRQWSTPSQSEGKKTCFGSHWSNQKEHIWLKSMVYHFIWHLQLFVCLFFQVKNKYEKQQQQ